MLFLVKYVSAKVPRVRRSLAPPAVMSILVTELAPASVKTSGATPPSSSDASIVKARAYVAESV